MYNGAKNKCKIEKPKTAHIEHVPRAALWYINNDETNFIENISPINSVRRLQPNPDRREMSEKKENANSEYSAGLEHKQREL